MTAPICFLDCETAGLEPGPDVIWEFAGVRREPDGGEFELHLFIAHNLDKAASLPAPFRRDHDTRFGLSSCITREDAARQIKEFLDYAGTGKPHVVGAVPSFDTERVTLLLAAFGLKPGHHYHLQDAENWAGGYLAARAVYDPSLTADQRDLMASLTHPPYDSGALSRAVGVEPPGAGVRHTAMGDVRWCIALWDAIHSGKPTIPDLTGATA